MGDAVEDRLAVRLASLRAGRGWSLEFLADRSGVSRSTLSRLERGEVSPTTALLGRICAAYGMTQSRLLAEVESAPAAALVRAAEQPVWRDGGAGFTRRAVSPPHAGLRAELIEGVLEPGADVAYDRPTVPGLEQHVWVLDGVLSLTDGDATHELAAGDCLRFRLWHATRFRNPGGRAVRYAIVQVLP
ncbi:helix-turn-helix domain-containing protein [Actinoplanes sp. NPDC049265]|uniref:helix-turn-helix domain-containing protein n=1 Tax=Actinoplanes sp. NPDC049265 TaxID=3363902 RepID=UPI0037228921